MEYQPCHGPDCHLNEGVSAIHIITINETARVNLFRVRCDPHPAAVEGNKGQDDVLQRLA